MRSPLTETIFKVQGMITYVRENLSTDEFMLFLDLLVPEPEPVKEPVKKKRKPRGDNKSSRASNMAATLNRSLAQQREAATKDITGESEPSAPICDTCGNLAGYVDHFQPSPSYHPFTVKGVAQAASAGD
jgi:hypothetical protein